MLCAILVAAGGAAETLDAQATNVEPLDAIAFLAGGVWRAEGKWPDGSALDVEVRYSWGPTRRVLHFETHNLAAGARQLLYEGVMFRDPKRGTIAQWNFKTSGEIDVSEVSRADSTGYEVHGANTRSFIRRRGTDEFEWELRVPQNGGWRTILRTDYRRRAATDAS